MKLQLSDIKDERLKELIEEYVNNRISKFAIKSKSLFDRSSSIKEILENIDKKLSDSEFNLVKYLNEIVRDIKK